MNTRTRTRALAAWGLAAALIKAPLWGAVDPSQLQPASERIVFHTEDGDLTLKLFPTIAPKTVAHILELVKAGAYDTTHFWRVEPGFVIQTSLVTERLAPLTDSQRALVHKVPLEASDVHHRRGILSMGREDNDPNSGESSFSILLGDAPHLDGKYTIFGEVESGMDTLERLEHTPIEGRNRPQHRLTILKAEIQSGPSSPSVSVQGRDESKIVLSPVYHIDRKYKSMEGPSSTQKVELLPGQKPQLAWIRGFKTEMVGADGQSASLPQFMCHVNLDFNPAAHAKLFGWTKMVNPRVLTLSQGQIDVQFPQGFGLPVYSNEDLSMTTQVLNNNLEKPDMQVRHKVTFDYVLDADAKEPLKPLFNSSVFGMKALTPADSRMAGMDMHHGQTCLPGSTAPNAHGGSVYHEASGQQFTGHWVVKPGREVNHTNVTKQLNLPFDTTLHYVAVHLHPFAESLELRDLTANKTIFKSKTRGLKEGIGLSHVDSFSSPKGIPMFKGHEYELISIYNNTTKDDQDSMAVMLLFLLDKEFKKPDPATVSAAVAPIFPPPVQVSLDEEMHRKENPRVRMKTAYGDMEFVLFPKAAPRTVEQFLALSQAGALDGTHFYHVVPGFFAQMANAEDRPVPLTPEQSQLLHSLPLEPSTLPHERGVLSMARDDQNINSAVSSYSILLGNAPHLNGKYTIFGKLVSGENTLKKIEAVERDDQNQPKSRLEIQKVSLRNPSKK